MDNRMRNGAIIGIVVTVVVVLVFVFMMPGNKCRLQTDVPKLDASTIVNYTSSDFKAMANFAGYLVYRSQEDSADSKKKANATVSERYLALELSSIQQNGSLGDPKQPAKLRLTTSCADLTLVLPTSNDVNKLVAFYFELDNISSDGDKSECTISSPQTIDTSQYYSCTKPKTYTCISTKDKTKQVAELHLHRLEFEVDGDPAAIKKGIFNKDRAVCKSATDADMRRG